MRISYLFPFLIFFLFSHSLAAQRTYRARVIDVTTKEPVPYANVYISMENGTLTNEDGEFSIKASDDDTLHISCIGYTKESISIGLLHGDILLTPLVTSLGEVVIRGMSAVEILDNVRKRFEKEYKKYKKTYNLYFCRTLEVVGEKTELIEAFLEAQSAANLRNISVLAGRSGSIEEGTFGRPRLARMNLHHVLEVGPLQKESPFWERIPKLLDKKIYENYYILNYDILSGKDGESIYKLTMNPNPRVRGGGKLISATLYIDAVSYQLLRCEAKMPVMQMFIFNDENVNAPYVSMSVDINYSNIRGFTEPSHIASNIIGTDFSCKTILFNVKGSKNSIACGHPINENMVASVDNAGYDSTLWAESEIIRRTAEEERIAFKQSFFVETAQNEKEVVVPADTTFIQNQQLQSLRDNLRDFGRDIPQEKVYIHMDNTCYFQGDTIWFAAYTRQTSNGNPSRISRVLYVELLNNDGFLVERKLIEMKEGRGSGFFALNHQIQYSGFYELRAYTRWQLNWGLFEHKHSRTASEWFISKDMERKYYRDYEKLYSRVFPVYDRPQAAGEYTRDMTMRVMQRTFKDDPDAPKPTLTLYPEGGNLVAGVENRVAFEATMSDGQQLLGTLSSPSGEVQVGGSDRGRGVFTIVPEKGMEREVMFTTEDGQTAKARLPKPEEQGVAVQVKQERDSIHIETRIVGLNADSLAMTIMHEGRLEELHLLTNGSGFKVQGSKLHCGVNQVTVFDTSGRVWADRLFFVTKPEEILPTLAVSGSKDVYQPYEQIILGVQGKAKNTPISLAVRDGYQTDHLYDNASILTEMLLSSEIRGFVPDPGWFFEKDDEEHREALDLLMMTQGWRRFDWRHMAVKGKWEQTQPKEQTPILKGKVYNFNFVEWMAGTAEDTQMHTDEAKERESQIVQAANKKTPSQEVGIHAEAVNIGNIDRYILPEVKTTGREFSLVMPRFHGSCAFLLAVADNNRTKRNGKFTWDELGENAKTNKKKRQIESSNHTICMDFHYPRFVRPYSFYQMNLLPHSETIGTSSHLRSDDTHQLAQLNVRAQRNRLRRFDDSQPAFIIDAATAENIVTDAGMFFSQYTLERSLFGDFGMKMPFSDVKVSPKHSSTKQTQLTIDKNDGDESSEEVPSGDKLLYNRIMKDRKVLFADTLLTAKEQGENDRNFFLRWGVSSTRRAIMGLQNIPQDSIYAPKYLRSFPSTFWLNMDPGERREYRGLGKIDKYVIYTDYCPRLEGKHRYDGANTPQVQTAVYPYPDGGRSVVFSDRFFVLNGFCLPAEFYSPDYSKQTPPEVPTDYRRTLYWNPNLKLDAEGRARVTLFNNSRTTQIEVEAAGQAADGTLLWNK